MVRVDEIRPKIYGVIVSSYLQRQIGLMFGLCKYKNMFGEPNVGLRKYRIFDIAILDTVVTVLIVYMICWFTKWPFWPTLAFVLVLGVFVHKLFCVQTGVAKKLFPEDT